jgi:hypothetical protein
MPTHVFNRAACSRPGSVTASSAAPHCSMTTAGSDSRTSNRAFASVASSSSRMPTPRPWSGWVVRLVRRRRRPRRTSGRTARNGSPLADGAQDVGPGDLAGAFLVRVPVRQPGGQRGGRRSRLRVGTGGAPAGAVGAGRGTAGVALGVPVMPVPRSGVGAGCRPRALARWWTGPCVRWGRSRRVGSPSPGERRDRRGAYGETVEQIEAGRRMRIPRCRTEAVVSRWCAWRSDACLPGRVRGTEKACKHCHRM